MKSLTDAHLYAFVDTAYLAGRAPAIVAGQLAEGGADLVQLRAKNWPAAAVQRLAEEIQPILERAGVPLVINDHLAVAQAVGAAYCHLGQEDFFGGGRTKVAQLFPPETRADAVRRRPGVRIGLSTHAPAQAVRALAADPAYVAIGPVYATGTKPGARPVTLEYVRWAAANIPIPWFAIGGINLENVEEVLAAGARRICVVSAILNAPDVVRACRQFRERVVCRP